MRRGTSSEDKDNDDDSDDDDSNDGDGQHADDIKPSTINMHNETVTPATHANSLTAGVGETAKNAGVDNASELNEWAKNAGVEDDEESMDMDMGTKSEQDRVWHEMDEWYGPRWHSINLQDHKPRSYKHLFDYEHALVSYEVPMGELFLTEQVSLKKRLKWFGKDGADAVVAELQ